MVSLSPQQHRLRFGDTTLTKVFVGGLAWETPTHELRSYFEQFGEILEAVIITDKYTGKSKGYGFVTFRDPESAQRAVSDPNPYINGRRANCNIASMAQPRPSVPSRNPEEGIEQGQAHVTGPPYTRLPAQMPPFQPQVYYPTPYGYMTYPSDYGYQQGIYNPQMTSQHYNHYYGTASSSVPSPQPYPYPYIPYNMHSPRPAFRPPVFTHRPVYVQHPTSHIDGSYLSSPPSNFQLQGHPIARQAPNFEVSQAHSVSQAPQQSTSGTNAESRDE